MSRRLSLRPRWNWRPALASSRPRVTNKSAPAMRPRRLPLAGAHTGSMRIGRRATMTWQRAKALARAVAAVLTTRPRLILRLMIHHRRRHLLLHLLLHLLHRRLTIRRQTIR